MSTEREFDLLADIAKLLRKYGPETFERLADRISDREFVAQLREILLAAARNSPARRARGVSYDETPSHRNFRSTLDGILNSDPERGEILIRIYDGLTSKAFLTSLREMQAFLSNKGLPLVRSSSRSNAVVPFVKSLQSTPVDVLRSYLHDIETASPKDDRSLEAWTDVIFARERPEEVEDKQRVHKEITP